MSNYLKPVEVTDFELSFGGNISKLLPSLEEIPLEYKNMNNDLVIEIANWFYNGADSFYLEPREGVDIYSALRHIKSILCSFEPKHEHKFYGCAYLLNEFFVSFKVIECK